jgi:hypothetical protein
METPPQNQEPRSNDLLKKYPDLIKICRAHDCSYGQGIKIIEDSMKKSNLKRWVK